MGRIIVLFMRGKLRELRILCRIFVQVVAAKIVTNAKSPGAKCYGFIMMASTEEASKCIQHLHRTELHGRMISVERVSCFHCSVSALCGYRNCNVM